MIRIPGKIPISIYPFFWLLAAGIGWINTSNILATLLWMVVILISVLVHEFGHALTALYFGQAPEIELIGFGGVTQRKGGGKLKLWQEFILVMNGPLAGLALGLLSFGLWQILMASNSSSIATYMVQIAFYINVFWTVLNLMPVQPLDGGKLLSIVLEAIMGLRGIKIALFISLALSATLGLLFFALQEVLIGVVFLMLAFENYRSWKSSLAVTEQDQNLILQHLLKEAERDMHNGYKDEALNKLQRIREISKAGVIYLSATEYAAAILVEKGDFKSAYTLLIPISNMLNPTSLRLLHQLAYRHGDWEKAVSLGTRSYQSSPSYDTAVINALCLSILGQVRPAIGWLQCAIREGLPNLPEILEKREFDNIRTDPLFLQLKKVINTAEE